jgi:hypothetical protein
MKKMIVVVALAVLSLNAFGAIRCVPSGGGTCCWDTDRDGIFKPVGC